MEFTVLLTSLCFFSKTLQRLKAHVRPVCHCRVRRARLAFDVDMPFSCANANVNDQLMLKIVPCAYMHDLSFRRSLYSFLLSTRLKGHLLKNSQSSFDMKFSSF